MTWHMRLACRITKARDTHSEYVIDIAFPQQRWLCERPSVLCHTYITAFVMNTTVRTSSCFPVYSVTWSIF